MPYGTKDFSLFERQPRQSAALAQTNTGGGTIFPGGFALGGILPGLALATGSLGQVSQDKAAASLMTDDHGNVIKDARGGPALVPQGFSAQMFVKLGQEAKSSSMDTYANLANFRQGGAWDLQRTTGKFDARFVDSATIAIGLYSSSAGIPFKTLMTIQNDYAGLKSRYPTGTPMDSTYTHLPARNVINTQIGYRLFENGLVTGQ